MKIRRSFFILDLGGLAWDKSAGYLTSIGYECHRVSFSDNNARNSSMDPTTMIGLGTDHEERDAADIATGLMGAKPVGAGDNASFFYDHSHAAIVAGLLFVRLTMPIEKQSLPTVASLFTPTAKKTVQQRFAEIIATKHDPTLKYGYRDEDGNPSPYHREIVDTFTELSPPNIHGETFKSLLTNIQRYLRPFRVQTIANAMRGLSVPPARFFDPDKPPVAVFVAIGSGSKESLAPIVRPIIEMYTAAWQEVDREGTDMWVEFVIDEADSWSPIRVLKSDAQVLRKHHVNLHLAFQGDSQKVEKYGQHHMIDAACAIQIVMTPSDDQTKRNVSERIGKFTYDIKGPEINGKAEPIEKWRMRLYPDEVARIPANRQLVFRRGVEPAYVYLPSYYNDPIFTQRAAIPPPFGPSVAEKAALEDDTRDIIKDAVLKVEHDDAQLAGVLSEAWTG